MKNTIILLIFLIFLNACAIKEDKTRNLSLRSDEKSFEFSTTPSNKSLKILNPYALNSLNSNQILYVQDGIVRAYAYHFWQDTPLNLCRFVFLNKLEQSKIFTALSTQNSTLKSDFVLESRLDNFEELIIKKQKFAFISLSFNLIDTKTNSLIAHKKISSKININKDDIDTILNAFDTAINSVGNELVLWLNLAVFAK